VPELGEVGNLGDQGNLDDALTVDNEPDCPRDDSDGVHWGSSFGDHLLLRSS